METVLGIGLLVLYVVAILALSAAITFAVVKISPAQSAKKKKTADEQAS